jgi:amino acid permease
MSSGRAGIILVVEVLGAVAMAVGAGMIFLPAGIMLAGFFALVFAVAFERSRA